MCGIFGYIGRDNATEITAMGLFAVQHRGQESCGIATSDGRRITLVKDMGYVKEVFYRYRIEKLNGFAAIGHVRYPTKGTPDVVNSQPHLIETLSGPIYAFASNGDVVNYQQLREKYEEKGVFFVSGNDGELIGKILVYHMEKEGKSVIEAIEAVMEEVRGAYSALFLTLDRIYAFRDPYGVRPMLVGELDGGYAVASESCSMDIIRAKRVREVEPAEVIVMGRDGMDSLRFDANRFRAGRLTPAHCSFEVIYFARPDSFQYGEFIYEARLKLGEMLAEKDSVQADAVVPVPDSSNFIALGYSRKRGIPLHFGLIRNHYIGRTFIQPHQSVRDESVRQKFNPLYRFFEGKRIVLVDDSIVRGTTLRKLVRMIKGAGAKEVHLRIGSPPVRFPCRYGIDTPTYEELIINQLGEVDKVRDYMEADSLIYLSVEELKKVLKNKDNFCYACFDGKYPIR